MMLLSHCFHDINYLFFYQLLKRLKTGFTTRKISTEFSLTFGDTWINSCLAQDVDLIVPT